MICCCTGTVLISFYLLSTRSTSRTLVSGTAVLATGLRDMSGGHDALALYDLIRSRGKCRLHRALDTLDAALRLYGPGRLAVAFNGGKDATVVLHLTRASIAHWARETDVPAPPVSCLYLPPGAPATDFPELVSFVRETVQKFKLSAQEVPGGMKKAIGQFQADRDLVSFVMGTRRNDPFAEDLEHFSPSSAGWPPFMRVNPIIEWEYGDVWQFLRDFEIPYCELYDHGYTSIGSVQSTAPNPALRVVEDEQVRYRPAWTLEDPALERAGRSTNFKKSAPPTAVNGTSVKKVD